MPEIIKCSCEDCSKNTIKEITIHAGSHFTGKKYKIWIFVCSNHYELEKKAGNIIDEIRTL